MRRTLLMQRMEQVLTPRERNLVRSYLGVGQPDEVGMTFQELAIRLNYNGPSGAEKAYKAALRKLKKDLYGGAYGRWLSAQKAIRAAKAEAEQDAGQYATPQRTWWEEQALAERFLCEIISLIHVYEIFSDISKTNRDNQGPDIKRLLNKQRRLPTGTRLCLIISHFYGISLFMYGAFQRIPLSPSEPSATRRSWRSGLEWSGGQEQCPESSRPYRFSG